MMRRAQATKVSAGSQPLVTGAGLAYYYYDRHGVSMIWPSNNGLFVLEALDPGATFTYPDFWRPHGCDELTISVTRIPVAPEDSLVIDLKLRLKSGGAAMVFLHAVPGHLTIKGSTFCGRNVGHVAFELMLRPLLGGSATVVRRESTRRRAIIGDGPEVEGGGEWLGGRRCSGDRKRGT